MIPGSVHAWLNTVVIACRSEPANNRRTRINWDSLWLTLLYTASKLVRKQTEPVYLNRLFKQFV